ncbi:hypothetical protein NEUTE1DRAFT_125018 [Neurospora tetrasperma FGSC 2508]|uniref:2EXR domain-containing protein n=1 Tax=Neurospora tetrasperma (strain FGSC 2508 / ATCC MYA-4615 / P0657) TaxID=510951 RepID=F8MWB9_NEUT8|nr:uncharacterized protein NEUTE1DRAFT_125018 [Neurospora tetrasperma FGSC 2508]EGO54914.1 hypothetical protein NEUTE1DRAFT_125018 [Neurospora tetrasperma FGSC 2508]EGZ67594.1 hypothetical protein NEUTE2DRAFT_116747 [Neurospora tetrasperma FGSC 2509]
MSPTTTTTFHLFPLLPLELRLQIWESTITPRTVLLRVGTRHWRPFTTQAAYSLLPTTSAPALLRTCHESREVGLKAYTQAFSEWDTDRSPGRCSPAAAAAARYLWVNFALDMIDIGGLGIQFVAMYKRQIRRLKLECDRANTVGRYEFGLLRDQLQTGEYERLREVEIGVRDDAWFPESWRRDGAFVEGWRLEVRNWEDGRGYTLLMERMIGGGDDDGNCG